MRHFTKLTRDGLRKVCSRCGVEKGESEYSRRASDPASPQHHILQAYCKACSVAENAKWRGQAEHVEPRRERQKHYTRQRALRRKLMRDAGLTR